MSNRRYIFTSEKESLSPYLVEELSFYPISRDQQSYHEENLTLPLRSVLLFQGTFSHKPLQVAQLTFSERKISYTDKEMFVPKQQ